MIVAPVAGIYAGHASPQNLRLLPKHSPQPQSKRNQKPINNLTINDALKQAKPVSGTSRGRD
jgi:hypothetical protein